VQRPWKDWKDPTEPFANTDVGNDAEHQAAQDAWWQWFELSPLEVGCDELEGWIPTWWFGRAFSGGQSLQCLPEQSLSLLLGLATSAPAGPLSSYLGTIGRNLPQNVFGDAVNFLAKGITREWGPQGTERFEDHHPIHAANEPNPFFHALAEEGRGNGIENSPRVHLIDSGMYVDVGPHAVPVR
jgi:phospholipase A2